MFTQTGRVLCHVCGAYMRIASVEAAMGSKRVTLLCSKCERFRCFTLPMARKPDRVGL